MYMQGWVWQPACAKAVCEIMPIYFVHSKVKKRSGERARGARVVLAVPRVLGAHAVL